MGLSEEPGETVGASAREASSAGSGRVTGLVHHRVSSSFSPVGGKKDANQVVFKHIGTQTMAGIIMNVASGTDAYKSKLYVKFCSTLETDTLDVFFN